MKIAVLGAGVSGLTAARRLSDKGFDVVVYEKCDKAGGLAKTRITNGYVYDPHGGHIFNSKHQEVVDWVFSLFPKSEWQFNVRNAKILFKDKYISYPFELSLCELDMQDAVDCVHDFILAKNGEKPDNYRDWLVWNFGRGIAERYMLPYNEKIWAYPLEKMETSWMEGKMPLPDKKEMIASMLLKDPTERKMPHSTFYYPLHGGIQSMIDKISEGLDLRTGQEIKSIAKRETKYIINNSEAFDYVISTIPLPELSRAMELPDRVKKAIDGLKFNSLTTVLCKCPETDISWLYVPDKEYRMHRIGYQSALTPYAAPTGTGSGAIEIIGSRFEVTKDIIRQKGVAPEKLELSEVLDYQFTDYAYVIHDLDYGKNKAEVLNYFDGINDFSLLGRFATWNYKNMDLCMLDAFRLTDTFK